MVSVGPARRSVPSASTAALGIVEGAIRQGVPMFNGGDTEGCARVYTQAVRSLIHDPAMGEGIRVSLRATLEKSQRLPTAEERAWELRHALDQVRSHEPGGRAAPPAGRSAAPGRRALCDFARGSGLEVRAAVVNDTVMGGGSESSVGIVVGEGAVFQGNVTRRGGGGFASVRFTPVDRDAFRTMLATALGLSLTVRCAWGCATWKVQLNETRDRLPPMTGGGAQSRNAGLWPTQPRRREPVLANSARQALQLGEPSGAVAGMSWQADFVAPEREARVDVPFSVLVPSLYGKAQGPAGLAPAARDGIESFGFMLSFLTADSVSSAAFQEGPFALAVKSVEVF